MKCPYCNNDMEIGYIGSGQPLFWSKGESRQLFSTQFDEGSVVLSKLSLFGSAVKAFLCRECQKILIDYSDEHSDLNAK